MKKETKTKSLLERWKSRDVTTSVSIGIPKAPEGAIIPLSPGQERLWFLQQMFPGNPFYNYSEIFTFNGRLSQEILIKSLKRVYIDHDILRTTYHFEDSKVFQIVDKNAELNIDIYDLSILSNVESEIEKNKILEADAKRSFDLSKNPLINATLIKINSEKHLLQITLHHIATDKWSMNLFREHLASYYRALSKNTTSTLSKRQELQYADYAYWLHSKEVNDKHLNYWKSKLSGEIPNLNMPTDYSRPIQPTFKGATSYTQSFERDISSKLLSLSKHLDTTPFTLLLSVYYVFLHRYCGQTDILIGSPVTNRDQKTLENLIGFFNETIILRTVLASTMSFENLVKAVRKNTLEAFTNKDVAFNVLVNELKIERSLSVNPFFQTMFLYHSVPQNPLFDKNVNLTHTWVDAKVSKFDLTIYISEENGILSSTFEYASDLFEEATINRFQNYFKSLIVGVITNPNQSITEIPMISDIEKKLVSPQDNKKSKNDTNFTGIHNIIENIAQKHPDRVAITFGKNAMTYKELNEKANSVAKELLNGFVKDDKIVGLCIERSLNMIVGMLGILKSGCAYLPIDPNYPKQRVNFMLEDAKVKTIVSENSLLPLFNQFKVNAVLIDNLKNSNHKKLPIVEETDLAYVIYTSGSTGQPKGVPITHKNIINSTVGRLNFYDENPSAFLLLSSISFDSSKAGIFWTLCTGGNLVITEKRVEQDIERIANIIEQQKVSHTLMLPSLYQVILENIEINKLKSLTTVIVAGEACSKSLCKIHFETLPNVSLYNEYGPTEASVWCIAHKIEPKDLKKDSIPIGKPVANAQVYLLDNEKNKVPIGVSGEIYIGGEGLSKGYLNNPELTSEVFIETPNYAGKKLYKTGDLAKYNNEGSILFLGRIDQQIKLRGYRVELDDIENTINKNELVKKSVVIIKQDEGSPKQLIAYLVPNEIFNENKLKLQLKEALPDYMIPSSFILIGTIPHLPNGKIDKKTLSKIKNASKPQISGHIEKPKNEIEQTLLDIWEDILNIKSLSTTDNFFEVGGDSISSIQFIAKARKKGIIISPNQIFDYQSIKELAVYISKKEQQQEDWNYLVSLRKGGLKKPLFCIHAGGGNVYFYKNLKKYIDKNRPIFALQASGVYGNHKMHESIEAMTRDYLEAMQSIQPHGPYNILVYCFSVTVGHEMMIQLKNLNQKANLIVMDTMADPWNLNTSKRLKIRIKGFIKRGLRNPLLTIEYFISTRILNLKQLFIKLFASSQEKALVDLNKNLIKVSTNYKWKPTKNEIRLILTEKVEKSLNYEIIKSWKDLISNPPQVKEVKGDHIKLFEEPNIKNIADEINKFLID